MMDLKALYKLGYGVYVVTSKKDDRINGQIANTVFQVTSDPPTVAVSLNKNNLSSDFIKESKDLFRLCFLPGYPSHLHWLLWL
jgi:flavin reductase (DIM6/NTAB) family NADH-FMN oxidoreductase RutF